MKIFSSEPYVSIRPGCNIVKLAISVPWTNENSQAKGTMTRIFIRDNDRGLG